MDNLKEMDAEELMKAIGEQMLSRAKQEQKNKVKSYQHLNKKAKKNQILFTGSSLMEQFPIGEIMMSDELDRIIYNRGIGGTTTDDFLEEIDTVLFDLEPSKVFINIGTNDFNERKDGADWRSHLLKNYENILQQIKERLPETAVYVMAYYPVKEDIPGNNVVTEQMLKVRTNENLNQVNMELKNLAERFGYCYIDVNDGIKDGEGRLRGDLTIEGIHMYAEAYQIIYESMRQYL